MFSASKISDDSLLDRARIRSQISELSKKQQELIQQLPSSGKPSADDGAKVDPKTWYQARSELYSSTSKLEDLLDIAEKTQPEQSTSEWQTAVLALQEAEETCRVLRIIQSVCRRLEKCQDVLAKKKFAETANELVELKRQLNDLAREERYGLKMISGLKARRIELNSALTLAIEQHWKGLIYVRSGQSVEEVDKDIVGIRLQYALDDTPFGTLLTDLLQSMKTLRIFDRVISEMATNLMEYVFLPVINGATIRVVCDAAAQTQTLFIVPWRPSAEQMDSASILDEVYQILDFLQTNLFVLGSSLNQDMISVIRNQTGCKLTQSIRNDAVALRLPTEFEQFNEVKSDLCEKLTEMEQFMVKSGWIASSDSTSQYSETALDGMFIEKCAHGLLALARRLYLSEKDVLTGVEKLVDPKTIKPEDIEFADIGNPRIFILQPMSISRSLSEIMESSAKLLQTAQSCGLTKVSLPAIRDAFSLWLELVPYHFQERLITVPVLSALYFSSCIHGSLHLYILNRMIQRSTTDQNGISTFSTAFADLVMKFRAKAYEVLEVAVAKSCKDIQEAINAGQTAWLSKIAVPKIYDILNRSHVKRGLDLLQRLSTVWSEILPLNVFMQATGKVIDAVLTDVFNKLISVEDINASDSATLCGHFKWIMSESEKLLKIKDADVVPFKYVSGWLRCLEVIFVLDASMSQIMERWADGNGPLAEHLASDELKKLVRALFENNDKRARLLAAIH